MKKLLSLILITAIIGLLSACTKKEYITEIQQVQITEPETKFVRVESVDADGHTDYTSVISIY